MATTIISTRFIITLKNIIATKDIPKIKKTVYSYVYVTILTHEIMIALKNIQYWIEITQYFNRFDNIHNYNVDNSMRWGWVV